MFLRVVEVGNLWNSERLTELGWRRYTYSSVIPAVFTVLIHLL